MDENKAPLTEEEEYDDYGPDYVTLTNDQGYEEEFELVDELDYNGESYVALLNTPGDDPEAYLQSDGRLFILKYVTEDGEEFLSEIEDDEEYEEISEIFMGRLSDLYEFEDDDEDED